MWEEAYERESDREEALEVQEMKFRDCKSGEKVIMVPVDGEDIEAWKLAKAFNELVEVVEEYRAIKGVPKE